MLRKCRIYDSYYRTGREQDQHGVFPQVLWLVDSERRRVQLTEVLRRDRRIEQALFQVATTDATVSVLSGATS